MLRVLGILSLAFSNQVALIRRPKCNQNYECTEELVGLGSLTSSSSFHLEATRVNKRIETDDGQVDDDNVDPITVEVYAVKSDNYLTYDLYQDHTVYGGLTEDVLSYNWGKISDRSFSMLGNDWAPNACMTEEEVDQVLAGTAAIKDRYIRATLAGGKVCMCHDDNRQNIHFPFLRSNLKCGFTDMMGGGPWATRHCPRLVGPKWSIMNFGTPSYDYIINVYVKARHGERLIVNRKYELSKESPEFTDYDLNISMSIEDTSDKFGSGSPAFMDNQRIVIPHNNTDTPSESMMVPMTMFDDSGEDCSKIGTSLAAWSDDIGNPIRSWLKFDNKFCGNFVGDCSHNNLNQILTREYEEASQGARMSNFLLPYKVVPGWTLGIPEWIIPGKTEVELNSGIDEPDEFDFDNVKVENNIASQPGRKLSEAKIVNFAIVSEPSIKGFLKNRVTPRLPTGELDREAVYYSMIQDAAKVAILKWSEMIALGVNDDAFLKYGEILNSIAQVVHRFCSKKLGRYPLTSSVSADWYGSHEDPRWDFTIDYLMNDVDCNIIPVPAGCPAYSMFKRSAGNADFGNAKNFCHNREYHPLCLLLLAQLQPFEIYKNDSCTYKPNDMCQLLIAEFELQPTEEGCYKCYEMLPIGLLSSTTRYDAPFDTHLYSRASIYHKEFWHPDGRPIASVWNQGRKQLQNNFNTPYWIKSQRLGIVNVSVTAPPTRHDYARLDCWGYGYCELLVIGAPHAFVCDGPECELGCEGDGCSLTVVPGYGHVDVAECVEQGITTCGATCVGSDCALICVTHECSIACISLDCANLPEDMRIEVFAGIKGLNEEEKLKEVLPQSVGSFNIEDLNYPFGKYTHLNYSPLNVFYQRDSHGSLVIDTAWTDGVDSLLEQMITFVGGELYFEPVTYGIPQELVDMLSTYSEILEKKFRPMIEALAPVPDRRTNRSNGSVEKADLPLTTAIYKFDIPAVFAIVKDIRHRDRTVMGISRQERLNLPDLNNTAFYKAPNVAAREGFEPYAWNPHLHRTFSSGIEIVDNADTIERLFVTKNKPPVSRDSFEHFAATMTALDSPLFTALKAGDESLSAMTKDEYARVVAGLRSSIVEKMKETGRTIIAEISRAGNRPLVQGDKSYQLATDPTYREMVMRYLVSQNVDHTITSEEHVRNNFLRGLLIYLRRTKDVEHSTAHARSLTELDFEDWARSYLRSVRVDWESDGAIYTNSLHRALGTHLREVEAGVRPTYAVLKAQNFKMVTDENPAAVSHLSSVRLIEVLRKTLGDRGLTWRTATSYDPADMSFLEFVFIHALDAYEPAMDYEQLLRNLAESYLQSKGIYWEAVDSSAFDAQPIDKQLIDILNTPWDSSDSGSDALALAEPAPVDDGGYLWVRKTFNVLASWLREKEPETPDTPSVDSIPDNRFSNLFNSLFDIDLHLAVTSFKLPKPFVEGVYQEGTPKLPVPVIELIIPAIREYVNTQEALQLETVPSTASPPNLVPRTQKGCPPGSGCNDKLRSGGNDRAPSFMRGFGLFDFATDLLSTAGEYLFTPRASDPLSDNAPPLREPGDYLPITPSVYTLPSGVRWKTDRGALTRLAISIQADSFKEKVNIVKGRFENFKSEVIGTTPSSQVASFVLFDVDVRNLEHLNGKFKISQSNCVLLDEDWDILGKGADRSGSPIKMSIPIADYFDVPANGKVHKGLRFFRGVGNGDARYLCKLTLVGSNGTPDDHIELEVKLPAILEDNPNFDPVTPLPGPTGSTSVVPETDDCTWYDLVCRFSYVFASWGLFDTILGWFGQKWLGVGLLVAGLLLARPFIKLGLLLFKIPMSIIKTTKPVMKFLGRLLWNSNSAGKSKTAKKAKPVIIESDSDYSEDCEDLISKTRSKKIALSNKTTMSRRRNNVKKCGSFNDNEDTESDFGSDDGRHGCATRKALDLKGNKHAKRSQKQNTRGLEVETGGGSELAEALREIERLKAQMSTQKQEPLPVLTPPLSIRAKAVKPDHTAPSGRHKHGNEYPSESWAYQPFSNKNQVANSLESHPDDPDPTQATQETADNGILISAAACSGSIENCEINNTSGDVSLSQPPGELGEEVRFSPRIIAEIYRHLENFNIYTHAYYNRFADYVSALSAALQLEVLSGNTTNEAPPITVLNQFLGFPADANESTILELPNITNWRVALLVGSLKSITGDVDIAAILQAYINCLEDRLRAGLTREGISFSSTDTEVSEQSCLVDVRFTFVAVIRRLHSQNYSKATWLLHRLSMEVNMLAGYKRLSPSLYSRASIAAEVMLLLGISSTLDKSAVRVALAFITKHLN